MPQILLRHHWSRELSSSPPLPAGTMFRYRVKRLTRCIHCTAAALNPKNHTFLSSSPLAFLVMANPRERSWILLQDSWTNEPRCMNYVTHSTTSPSTTTFSGRSRKSLSDWIFVFLQLTSRLNGEHSCWKIMRAESSSPTNSYSRATSLQRSPDPIDSAPMLTPFIARWVVLSITQSIAASNMSGTILQPCLTPCLTKHKANTKPHSNLQMTNYFSYWWYLAFNIICLLRWPIAYNQKIKIVKVRLAPVQSMPII